VTPRLRPSSKGGGLLGRPGHRLRRPLADAGPAGATPLDEGRFDEANQRGWVVVDMKVDWKEEEAEIPW